MRRRSASSFVSPGPLCRCRRPAATAPSLGADEARQQVFQLRELDLQLAFARSRAPREDVEDQLRAIDHLAIEPLVELAQLRRRQLVVEDDEVGVGFRGRARQHLDLAAAEECRGVRLRAILQHAQDDACARGFGKATEFFEGMFRVDSTRAAGDQTDERCPFDEHWTPCTHCHFDSSTAFSAYNRPGRCVNRSSSFPAA